MLIILSVLTFFGLMAWFFKANSSKSEKIERLSHYCPCTRFAKTGFLSKLLIYTGAFIFMFNGIYLQTNLSNKSEHILQIIMALFLVFLGYKVSKENE
ncbi:hypothetical protein [Campylobacter canadensis]|uniref:Small hydrophobic protein n=1 Tax=Campylobacter canadensis TaxID=449520 RepID=A0ABS7WRQ7_9BACT|nr:hypothetical protein [Campylobacter canadensis]MBZ7987413.1 hypothetical protein [Campylobacter canadensis]MBZ7995247.1 hypothetical protein [Campylobacter canadensis]MBZ7996789.1 hypothetical protein [Campylobacter canadensis]MBZ7998608.1 hypothetical protein [Campylobacter canadensis]MBZ8000631.1 hypothetical protein [Campylobacter canadensis]